jgi:hypothetical protein
MVEPATTTADAQRPIAASTQVLKLSKGVYRFSVVVGSRTEVGKAGDFVLPAVYLALGPDTSAKAINLIPGPSANGTWLCGPDDLVFAGVTGSEAKLLITSIPAAGGEALEIAIERVDGKVEPKASSVITPSSSGRAKTTASLSRGKGSAGRKPKP